ncbi:MAG: DUF2339 domain-containing protein [Planctomycetota bacterium]|jgi:uncharacterized membrane protein
MKRLDDRVRNLERRVAALERELQGTRAEGSAPGPEPAAALEPAAPVAPREATKAVALPEKPAKPPRSLEVDFGRWMSRLGGASLVVATGFLFAYAAERGWLTPTMRVVLGIVSGAALVASGEWQHKRLRSFAAALTGAGIGVLYVSVYAGYAFLDLFSMGAALAFAIAITAGGAIQALRHDMEAIAGLAAAGAFFAPAIVLDQHAQPQAILAYVLVLNAGLCLLRARKEWHSAEIIAWLGTPLVVALPLTQVDLDWGIAFLLANVALFGVRPRLKAERISGAYTLMLAAVTTGVSYVLFRVHETPNWSLFAGGLAVVLAATSQLGAKRSPAAATADLYAAAGIAVLALLDGYAGWEEAVGWSALALALLLAPLPRLRPHVRRAGAAVALLAVAHLVFEDAWVVEYRLVAFLAAAVALAAVRAPAALWGAVVVASVGLAAEVAALRDENAWTTLCFLEEQWQSPSTRLLAGGTLGLILGLFALHRGNRRVFFSAATYLAVLLIAEVLFVIEGDGFMPLGLVAALGLMLLPRKLQSIWAVTVALALAVAADLLPPADYLPFLNRRAFALGGVLAMGWFLLRGRPEGRASMLALLLLAAAEIASIPDPQGGKLPWHYLYLDLRAPEGIAPFWNARFFFLAGASAVAFLAARRWRAFAVLGHAYVVVALGAEVVGLVPMGPHLALTGVILTYGAALVTAGILGNWKLSRQIGLGMLLAGGLKVSVLDLTALGDLYRVGSFVVLGATYLAGSYAYNRWVTPPGESARQSRAA